MMRWVALSDMDRGAYRAAITFLKGRLRDVSTIDWALHLKPNDHSKRAALLDLVDGPDGINIGEPWHSAWRLIQESWSRPLVEDRSQTRVYYVKQKLESGDRSGVVTKEISELVSPFLRVEPFSEWRQLDRKRPKRISDVEHLFSVGITSGSLVSPHLLGLDKIKDIKFLTELANELDAAVVSGLDIARRLGWDDAQQFWRLGQLHRVYYVPRSEWLEGGHEPDEFDRGIAPSVKLLHFTVSRLADIDLAVAMGYVRRWKHSTLPIYLRLWASLARSSEIASPKEVAEFLLSLNDKFFWNQNVSPEISELRAIRFVDLSPSDQKSISRRLRKRPPRSQWQRNAETSRIEDARIYWAVRELRRIEIAGGNLPSSEKAWLSAQIEKFPDLAAMSSVHEGFMGGPTVRSVSAEPDARYDLLIGEDRLKALEAALSSSNGGWEDRPAEGASVWIRQTGSLQELIGDFELSPDSGASFSKVWDAFGWAHSPTPNDDLGRKEAARVLSLLSRLPDATLRSAIDGVSNWLSRWERQFAEIPEGFTVWERLWSLAVIATNQTSPITDQADLQTVARPSDDHEPMDLDTLNTPAGKLVGVFLAKCPTVKAGEYPFSENASLKAMRDTVISASGRAGLIVKHRMIEHLPYFLLADSDWTREHLIAPLVTDKAEALPLWRAVARQTRFTDVLNIIGDAMADHANDPRLGRDTRQSLVFSLVIECLGSLMEKRPPAVSYARVQQVIRALDDEVRSHGAGAIQRYVRDVSSARNSNKVVPSPEELFRLAAKPFLQQVWPQEQSLSTPGVSRALADLPSTARGAFADAVDAVERFLVPFECWSMLDYGLYGEEDGEPKLTNIDDPEKADAFLRLLHRTIGDSETSVIPMDLGDALDQVRKVAPSLVETPIFRRLATAARRV